MKSGISVCFIIKNGIRQGYPFWESLQSCLPFANEIVISEGGSDDGTAECIAKFISKYGTSNGPEFRVFRDNWNEKPSQYGEVIAWISEKNFRRCAYEWVYYLQADEVIHEGNVEFIKSVANGTAGNFNSVSFEFCHFIHSWEPLPKKIAYDQAIRMVRNRHDIKFLGDAWNFQGSIEPVCRPDKIPCKLYHLGWVFPENCDIKKVEHGKLYSRHVEYQAQAREAKERIALSKYESGYDVPSDPSSYPLLISRLYGKVKYELPEEAK